MQQHREDDFVTFLIAVPSPYRKTGSGREEGGNVGSPWKAPQEAGPTQRSAGAAPDPPLPHPHHLLPGSPLLAGCSPTEWLLTNVVPPRPWNCPVNMLFRGSAGLDDAASPSLTTREAPKLEETEQGVGGARGRGGCGGIQRGDPRGFLEQGDLGWGWVS